MLPRMYAVIGKHIRDARGRSGLTQARVAQAAEMPLSYYGRMERGQIRPNIDRLARACMVLRIPMSDVFMGVEESPELLTNRVPTDAEFERIVLSIGSQVGEKARGVMLVMCQQIATLDK